MDQILAGIGSALAGFFGSPVVQFVIYSILAYLVVLWLASAFPISVKIASMRVACLRLRRELVDNR